jgi:hypothetical protein
MTVERIDTRAQLIALQQRLQLREDWHEPDEREVSAVTQGSRFDNAGFWGAAELAQRMTQRNVAPHHALRGMEQYVTIRVDGQPVAEVNLATLFAFACGYEGE